MRGLPVIYCSFQLMTLKPMVSQIVDLEMDREDKKITLDDIPRKIALLQPESSIQMRMELQWQLTALINVGVMLKLE